MSRRTWAPSYKSNMSIKRHFPPTPLILIVFILQDQERRTPLHAAACVGDVHIMDLLIESGK